MGSAGALVYLSSFARLQWDCCVCPLGTLTLLPSIYLWSSQKWVVGPGHPTLPGIWEQGAVRICWLLGAQEREPEGRRLQAQGAHRPPFQKQRLETLFLHQWLPSVCAWLRNRNRME